MLTILSLFSILVMPMSLLSLSRMSLRFFTFLCHDYLPMIRSQSLVCNVKSLLSSTRRADISRTIVYNNALLNQKSLYHSWKSKQTT